MNYKYIFGNIKDFELLGYNVSNCRKSLDNLKAILGIEFNDNSFDGLSEFKIMSENEAQNFLTSKEAEEIWFEKEIPEVKIIPEKIIKEKEKKKEKRKDEIIPEKSLNEIADEAKEIYGDF